MALILAPTRELSSQIYDEANKVVSHVDDAGYDISVILVCLSYTYPPVCGLRWSRYWWSTKGFGERMSLAGSHSWPSGGYDGAGKNRTRLLQVCIPYKYCNNTI